MSIDIDKLEALCKRTSMWGQASTILELIARLRDAKAAAAENRKHIQAIADMVGEGDDIGAAWESVNAILEELAASQAREQALAAHVEAQATELAACQSILHQLARSGEVTPDYAKDAKRVLEEKPTTSLARLKAEWQAEALEKAAGMAPQQAIEWLLNLADDYRRQAEEGQS